MSLADLFTGPSERPPRADGHVPELDEMDRRERRWGLLFVAPWLFGLVAFYLFPLVASLAASFTNYQLVGEDSTRFIGLDNWRRLLEDPEVRTGAWVTFKFSLTFVPMAVLLPLFFAWILTAKQLWGRSFFRVMFFLPTMVPFISAVFVWGGFFNSQSGWVNKMLSVVGIEGPDWLNSPTWILPGLTAIATWGVGNAMVIFIASLNGVPTELYEAAKLDGAGPWRLFRDVTWPMISPITFYNLIITLVGLGQYFIVPFALTEGTGDPDGSALFYTMYFYRQTFGFFRGGYGATLAWAMFFVVLAITGLLFWSAKFWVHYEYSERT